MIRALLVLSSLHGCARPVLPTSPAAAPPAAPRAPADARSWYLQAVRAEAVGDDEKARQALEWVVRLDRDNPDAWLAAARIAERLGDDERAAALREGAAQRVQR